MKILRISSDDIELNGDWLKAEVAERFVRGRYTHVKCEDGTVFECGTYDVDMVDVGKPVTPPVGEQS